MCGLGLAYDARLKLAENVLAVKDQHPIAGTDGFTFRLGQPLPFPIAVL
jgi:hypothetical protein